MTESDILLRKALVGSGLDSRQWNLVQAGFRNRAFFSSRVASVRVLAALREGTEEYARGGTDLSKIRIQMREKLHALGYSPEPGKEGTIHDLFSQARLDVIIKTNVAQARGYMQYLEGTSPGAFAAFPAQEFRRIEHRRHPREDWPQRWAKAGGRLYGGKMIALKDDPVWERLSVFGNPFPPFDWGSGMGVLDVDRKTAIALGLVTDDQLRGKVAALRERPAPDFNANLQAEIPMRDDSPEAAWLKSEFGDQVKFDGGVAHWQGEMIQDVLSGKLRSAKLGRGYDGRNLSISHSIIIDHIVKHTGENEKDPRNLPLSRADFELIPAMWHKPDDHSIKDGKEHLTLATFDGGMLHLFIDQKRGGISTFYKTKGQVGA